MVSFAFATLVAGRSETLKWEQRTGYRVARLNVPKSGKAGFTLLTPAETGIHFTNQLSYERGQKNQNLLNGAGVASGDFDGDGNTDLYFCNLEGANGLFRNLGNWKFTNVTAEKGVGCTNMISRSAVFADVDGDGKVDLFVAATGGPNALFMNDGSGGFKNVTENAGLVLKAGCHTIALADIDGDGDLDLYIANYGETSILRSGGSVSVRTVNGKPVVTGRYANRIKIISNQMVEYGEPHALYINDGNGKFHAASWTDGTFMDEKGSPLKMVPYDMGLSAMFRDLNGDGFPDLYVCNDFQTPDRIWMNDGKGRFRALPDLALRTTSHFSMGVDFADIDRDGFDDFFVTDMLSRYHKLLMTQISPTNPPLAYVGELTDRQQARRNTLQLNRGDVTWRDIANFAGVAASDWSWSPVFLDVDLDGYEDLLISNGHAYDTQDLDASEKNPSAGMRGLPLQSGHELNDFPKLSIPNVAFRNRGDRTFEDMSKSWGFDSKNVSHGISLADLDNDGDMDVIVSCLWEPPLIYRNDSSAPRVAVRLRGKSPNTQGIGAKIKLLGGAVPAQTQEIISGGRYLSGDDPMRVFAAGSAENNKMTLEVAWRSGLRSVIAGVTANHIYEVEESEALPGTNRPVKSESPALFTLDVAASGLLHREETFDDFERQPLIPKMLSRFGPGVAWIDMDGDGHEDLVMGMGKGRQMEYLRNDGKGNFILESLAPGTTEDDLTGITAWTPSLGKRVLLMGLANYESTEGKPSGVLAFSNAKAERVAVNLPASAGPLAVADVNGDGALDVFVGGRVIPGKYPEAASSMLFLNRDGRLMPDDNNNLVLRKVGLVSSAVWSDLDGDGSPDLVLACEWGPVRVFMNHQGKLQEATTELGLSGFSGWWNGVTTADVDGDGKLDIIASNWGLNSSYRQPSQGDPAQMYYGDLDGNGTVDLLEARLDPETGRMMPIRNLLITSAGIPMVREHFPTHKMYSETDLPALLGPQHAGTPHVDANTFSSMVFLNRGNKFQAMPLPPEAQLSPAFGISVADFNGDGAEDIFLGQNCFAVPGYEPRLDAGRGLLLLGKGDGSFAPMAGQSSGIKVYGEQRGTATGDYDEDGRPDLAVTQNSGPLQVFRNQTGKPGLRVRLKGPLGNPDGIGAVLRVEFASRLGPAREIHAGSGYWSQDGAVQVLATPEPAQKIIVRWPWGKATTQDVPAGAKEITVAP
ncbi:MAG: ASPIC/UnbV domain protein [Verrucomicrobiales bacterium]|nr:ASPIC/UnbV domain protein [Verrucomicrobiales bacterium]